MKNQTFTVSGMHCPSCKKLIGNRVKKIIGVNQVNVNIDKGNIEIASNRDIALEEITKALAGTDYQVTNKL